MNDANNQAFSGVLVSPAAKLLLERIACDWRINGAGSFVHQAELIRSFVACHLPGLLDAVCADETALRGLASRSYAHSSGFVRYPLCAMHGFEIRLHQWYPLPESRAHEPHQHRGDFCSLILAGEVHHTLRDEIPVDSEDGMWAQRMRFVPRGEDGLSRLEMEAWCRIGARRLQKLAAGAFYWLEHHEIHVAAIPEGASTVTLMIAAPACHESRVWYPEGAREETVFSMPPLTPEHVRSSFETISNQIKQGERKGVCEHENLG